MIGLALIENRLAGQMAKLDESLMRLRSLLHALEDVADGVVTVHDDSRMIAEALIAALLLEVTAAEEIRGQLHLCRYLLKVRGPLT